MFCLRFQLSENQFSENGGGKKSRIENKNGGDIEKVGTLPHPDNTLGCTFFFSIPQNDRNGKKKEKNPFA